jgi:molybdenum cofactor biosynthesis protein MoaC
MYLDIPPWTITLIVTLDKIPKSMSSRTSPWSKIPVHMISHLPAASQMRLYHNGCSKPGAENPRSRPSPSLPTTSDADLPHLTPSKNVHMTQITEKPETKRVATAACSVSFSNARPWEILQKGQHTHKGDVFSVARIAGITAAKRTPDIVPLCHPGIGITGVEVGVDLVEPAQDGDHGAMNVVASVSCFGRTGVEMEAMTATMGAALTIYDMLKAVDKGMVIGNVRLLEKQGGKSGHWLREEEKLGFD